MTDFFRKSKTRLLFISTGLLLACGILIWKSGRKNEAELTYNVAYVQKGVLNSNVLATGTVAPYNRVDLKPSVAGRIEKILVEEGEKVKQGQILVWMSSTERAALVDAARAQGPEELKRWEEAYHMTPILAPVNGVIISKNLVLGQTVATTDIILSMSDALMIKAIVDETDLAKIAQNQRAKVTLDAYPDSPIEARVDKISFDARTINNVTTYEVDVLPLGAKPFMRSGMTANIEFLVKSDSELTLVPSSAIQKRSGSLFVLVTPNDNPEAHNAKLKEIRIGNSDGKYSEVLEGLNPGDKVLVPDMNSLKQIKSSSENQGVFGSPPRKPKSPSSSHPH